MSKHSNLYFILGQLLGAGWAYQLGYRYYNPLLQENPGEENLMLADIKDYQLDWISSVDYQHRMVGQVAPYLLQRLIKSNVVIINNHPLAYQHWSPNSVKGTVVLVHGFNEFKEKYLELIYYLLQAGYEVFAYDLRGHGFSKLDPDQTQIDNEDFGLYREDLAHFISIIVKKQQRAKDTFIYSHSMGGAVTLSLLDRYPTLVKAAIFSTPMFEINTYAFSDSQVYLYTLIMNRLGWGKRYLPTTESFDREKHSWFLEELVDANQAERTRFYHYLDLSLHQTPTRGASNDWFLSSTRELTRLLDRDRLQAIKTPSLIFRGELDAVVRKQGIFTVGSHLPNVERVFVPGGQHELLMEKNRILEPYINRILQFMEENLER